MVVALSVVAILGVLVLIGYAVRAPYETRPFQCEVCGRHLRAKQAVEVTEEYPEEFGGTSMTATFCKKDRP